MSDRENATRVHQTTTFTRALLGDEKAFGEMAVAVLLEPLREGKNVVVMAPPADH